MSQTTEIQIQNQAGLPFRQKLNLMLSALDTEFAGAVAPTVTEAYMRWLDTSTTPPTPKRRNAADTGWDIVVDTTAAAALPKAGGTMTGPIVLAADAAAPLHPISKQQFDAALSGVGVSLDVSQTVFSGPLDSNGYAACVGTGAGLSPVLKGTTAPVLAAFAAGYGNNGKLDYTAAINVDTAWTTLAANNNTFLSVDRNATTGAPTLTSSLAPPQYGQAYDRTKQALLHFEGADLSTNITDDFGNAVTLVGTPKLSTTISKFGTTSLKLNGTTDFIRLQGITQLPGGGWKMNVWFNFSSFSNTPGIFSAVNASGYGISLFIYTNGKTDLSLSSNGTTWNITNSNLGAGTATTNTLQNIELSFDVIAGKYTVRLNGVVDQEIASALPICAITGGIALGVVNASNPGAFAAGYFDEFLMTPYNDHPAGTAFTLPTSAFSIGSVGFASDFYSIPQRKMFQISGPSTVAGTDPTMALVQRVYVGEAITGPSAVSSATSYAYNGKYDSGLFAVSASTTYSKAHNIGTQAYNLDVTMADDINGSNERPAPYGYITTTPGWAAGVSTRNAAGLFTASNVGSGSTGGVVPTSNYRMRVRRAF